MSEDPEIRNHRVPANKGRYMESNLKQAGKAVSAVTAIAAAIVAGMALPSHALKWDGCTDAAKDRKSTRLNSSH